MNLVQASIYQAENIYAALVHPHQNLPLSFYFLIDRFAH